MRVRLPLDIARRLVSELRSAGRREIGGLLMGEHVEGEVFRIVDISVQRHGGNSVCFVRRPEDHAAALEAFFESTCRDFTRFNYLGEWHSHPSFHASPSRQDLRSMQEIVEDPDVGVNFAVLLIVRSRGRDSLEASTTAFRAGTAPITVELEAEGEYKVIVPAKRSLLQQVRRLFGF